MQIDWVTVVAQLLNFAVLVALLRRFLYGPILRTIDRREQAIAARVGEAETKRAEAEADAERLAAARAELEATRTQFLDGVRREAGALRDQLLEEGRQEVADTRERWRAELRREEEAFRVQLRQEMAQQAARLGRRVLRDLAARDFEAAIVDAFLRRLGALEEPALAKIRPEAAGQVATVHLSFEPDAALRDRIAKGVRQHFGSEVEVRFQRAPELLCGVALHINGRRLSWSVDQYLAEVEESVANLLAEAAAPAPAVRPVAR